MAGKFEVELGKSGKYHFNLKAGNGQTILSSEMYDTKAAALNGANSVKNNGSNDARFERKKAVDGQFYFVLKAANGQEIGRSELYTTEAAMENGIKSVMTNSADASIIEN